MKVLVWFASTPTLMLLIYLLVRRRAYRAFPWFFTYVAYGLATACVRLALHGWPRLYYYAFWTTDAGYWLLGILAMYEVFHVVLEELAGWWVRLVFPAALVAGVALSLAHARAVPPRVNGLHFYFVIAETAVRFVQVFAVLLTLIPLFGRRGHRYALGIAAGFGLYSTIQLLNTMEIWRLGKAFEFWWNVTQQVAYSLAVVIWIWAFLAPQNEKSYSIPESADPENRHVESGARPLERGATVASLRVGT